MTSERPVRILHATDGGAAREPTAAALRRAGFEVITAATGIEALAATRRDIDLVLLDGPLPDLDSVEVCRQLRSARDTAAAIVVVTVASWVTSQHKIAALDAGADGCVVETADGAELIATMRALLRARAGERRAVAATQALQASLQRRDDFLALLGHELRNPIGALTTALHLLDTRRGDDAIERYLPVLTRQTRTLSRLVDELLDVAQLTRGQVTIERGRVDLRALVERCVQALRVEVVGVPPKVDLTVSGPSVHVLGDAIRLEQSLGYLITNAVAQTPQGGHVEVRVGELGGNARLEVLDDGVGMDAAAQARAFEPFAHGKLGIDRARGGLGVGLTVVRKVAELHGGTIDVTSPGPGQGSTYTLLVPLAPSEPVAPSTTVMPPSTSLHVAVIEDNDDAREALADLLTLRGYHVETAPDGRAGLALVLASKPDLVLMDIGLPLCDGYEVARAICAAMEAERPRLIAMTGYGQPEDRQRALDAGFDVHLVKPLSIPQLDTVLREHQQRMQLR